jgi:hypothetical protein
VGSSATLGRDSPWVVLEGVQPTRCLLPLRDIKKISVSDMRLFGLPKKLRRKPGAGERRYLAQHRKQKAMDRHNRFYDQYVPELGPEALGKPGVHHMVFHHDQQCRA